MIEWLMSDELERIWREVVMTLFKVLTWNFSGSTEEHLKKKSVGIVGVTVKI
jgi:hypothetical protein